MIQQPHHQLSFQSSQFQKYVAMSSFDLAGSRISQEASILCTPENYMLVLGYCGSLEKEVQELKSQLNCVQCVVQQLKNKNGVLQSMARQAKSQKRKETNLKAGSAISFGMVSNSKTERMNKAQFEEKEVQQSCRILNNEILGLLKQENEGLKKKINKLYKQNERLIDSYQKYLKLDSRAHKKQLLGAKLECKQSFEILNFRDSFKTYTQEATRKTYQQATNLGTSVAKPVQRVILSEPNSFDISFQAFPSFKSLEEISTKPAKGAHDATFF